MKRTALKRVSPRRAVRRAAAKERFQDGHGVYFDEVRLWLPDNVKDWPRVRRVDDIEVVDLYRWRFCYLCPHGMSDAPHHLVGGTRGRSDECCNLIPLCRPCHAEVQSQPAEYKRVWRAKWEHDWANCDWVRLILLLGRWPDFDSLD